MKKTGRQSKNIEDRTGPWGADNTNWGNGRGSAWSSPDLPEVPPSKRVSDSLEVAAMRNRQSKEMQDRIKGRTRFTSSTFAESLKRSKSPQTRPKYRQYEAR